MKNSRSRSLTFFPASTSAAFTLIELLVVISIIALLAGMIVAAASGVQVQARKASAKNDLSQIVTAVKSYYVDYGQYPQPTTTQQSDFCYGPSPADFTNDQVINILRYGTMSGWTDNASSPQNPRQIKYLEVADVKNPNAPASGIVESGNSAGLKAGTWVDPWGKPYVVFIDGDYDGVIKVSTFYQSGLTTSGSVAISCGAASVGLWCQKNNKSPGGHPYDKTTDLLSWQ